MLCKNIKLRKLTKPILNSTPGVKLICLSSNFLVQIITPIAINNINIRIMIPTNGFKPVAKFCWDQITDSGKRVNSIERT